MVTSAAEWFKSVSCSAARQGADIENSTDGPVEKVGRLFPGLTEY